MTRRFSLIKGGLKGPKAKDPMEPVLTAFQEDFPSTEELERQVEQSIARAEVSAEEVDAAADAILSRLSVADPIVHREPAAFSERAAARARFLRVRWLAVPAVAAMAAAAALALYVPPAAVVHPAENPLVPLAAGPGLALGSDTVIAKQVVPTDGASVRVAVLTSGAIRFERHNGIVPEVDEVRWERVPLIAHPVGTVFDAQAIGDAALVAVSEGRVELRGTDGINLGTIGVGEMAVVRMSEAGLDRTDVANWSLGRIEALGVEGPALSDAVANLRLQALPSSVVSAVKETTGQDKDRDP